MGRLLFICKVGLGLMGAEEGLGLAAARLVKCEDTLDSFLDSRRNFSEISRASIFAIVTNPPWDSLDFDETQFYRAATGGSLPKRKSLNNSKGAKLVQLQRQVADFDNWIKKNKTLLENEKKHIELLRKKCIEIETENEDYFHGKRNLAIHFLYVINRLLEGSGGAYLVVLPDRFFVGEDCPIRDFLIDEIEAYIPFQNCGNIFEGVANGTRFGVIFGRKGIKKDDLTIDIPIVENNVPVDFASRKLKKDDLRVGEITRNGKVFENRVLPFFKDTEDVDLQTHWLMNRHELTSWGRGRINVGIRGGPGEEYGKMGGPDKFKVNIVKSATHKRSDDSKLMGQLKVEFGSTVEVLPERLKQHYKQKKIVMSNTKTDGIRKVAVGIAQNCLPEKDYNYNESLDESDLWWLQSLTLNRLVNNLAGSYHINSGTMNFLGKLEVNKQIPLGFLEREVFLLRTIGFSLQKAVEYIVCVLLEGFDKKFILGIYQKIHQAYPEQFVSIEGKRLLVEYQFSLIEKSASKKVPLDETLALKRLQVATFVLGSLKADKYLGRTKLEKCLYILEANNVVNLEGNYMRKAAGPLDSDALYNKKLGIEAYAEKYQVFEALESKQSKKISYKTGKNFDSTFHDARQLLGKNLTEAQRLLNIMRPASTEQAEIIATVFAAWNDLLQAGQKINDDVIVNEVRKNWTATKARFTPERLKIAIKWLKERELVPRGVGPRTLK